MLHSRQIKAARGLLKMHQKELAEITGISLSTIKKLELEEEAIGRASQITVKKIKTALESRGIRFSPSQKEDSIVGIGVSYFPVDEK